MIPSQHSLLKWEKFSIHHLPVILGQQEELYSLNFTKMNFDDQFYQNITQWYTEGIEEQGCHSHLLYDGFGELIGFYLFQKNDSTVYLMQMFVAKTFRRKGYGQLLLENYELTGKQMGAISSFLHASSMNQQAVSFYQRNGYHIIDQEREEDSSPRYLMFKSLTRKLG